MTSSNRWPLARVTHLFEAVVGVRQVSPSRHLAAAATPPRRRHALPRTANTLLCAVWWWRTRAATTPPTPCFFFSLEFIRPVLSYSLMSVFFYAVLVLEYILIGFHCYVFGFFCLFVLQCFHLSLSVLFFFFLTLLSFIPIFLKFVINFVFIYLSIHLYVHLIYFFPTLC